MALVTGGWAATNTLRDNTVTLHYYSAKERHVDGADCPACSVTDEALAALALVEAALDAAEALRDFLEDEKATDEPPRELMDKGYAAMETFADYHREEALADALAAALRAVREGK